MSKIDGTSANDVIFGKPCQKDEIHGNGGNDTIYGMGGADKLYGGKGNDCISGGRGDDYIEGGPGNDIIDGGHGNDTIVYRRGDGNDTILGGPMTKQGNDVLIIHGFKAKDVTIIRADYNLWVVVLSDGAKINIKDNGFGVCAAVRKIILKDDGTVINMEKFEDPWNPLN